jgi:ADP-heptose:LPS heptosyltransferase
MRKLFLLKGGIGDFLQCIPFIKASKHNIPFMCVTHLKGAKLFFDAIGIQLEKLFLFQSEEEKIKLLNSLPKTIEYLRCPRTQYFDKNPFNIENPLFENNKPIVGFHINGSSYAIETQRKFGMILKSIPAQVIKGLISEEYNVLVFGLKEEIYSIGLEESESLRLIAHENPAKSLAYVQQCRAVVASDSGIKTMSSMLKIPTIVWLGDYQDPPRDQMFIDPYVRDGVMQTFRYKNLDADLERGLKTTKEFLTQRLDK